MVEKHQLLFKRRSSSLVMKRGNLCWIRQESHHQLSSGQLRYWPFKAGLAIPWNKLRLLRRYVTTYSKGTNSNSWCFRWLKSSGICLAGEERMCHISSQIVGDNLKGEIAPFSVTIPSGGEEIKGAPLVFIPHLVDKVVQLLDGNER